MARNGPPRVTPVHSGSRDEEDEDEGEDGDEGRRRRRKDEDDEDEEEEVVVITGGGRGLGECVAGIYGIKGTAVAVLDLEAEKGERETEGVRMYKCDVGNRAEVESVWARVVADVRLSVYWGVLASEFGRERDPDWGKERLTFSLLNFRWGHRQF